MEYVANGALRCISTNFGAKMDAKQFDDVACRELVSIMGNMVMNV